jgi:[acyl-carrier-protein] S-malonyltransferase
MLAFVFPGQGSQVVGMGKELAAAEAAAREVFGIADEALGFSLSRLCFEGSENELQLTANAQPAILACSIAWLRVLEQRTHATPAVAAGHSLGEYTALVAAGAIELADALQLVRQRGRFMQQAVPAGEGSMAALAASAEVAERICREAASGEVVAPANYNSKNQVVIAGKRAAVERAVQIAEKSGVVGKLLKVSAPFHCELMRPAAEQLRAALAQVSIKDPRFAVISNVDAMPTTRADDVRRRLYEQVFSPVRWESCVRALKADGAKRAIEIGPGKVLTSLMKRIDPQIEALACGTAAELDAATAKLGVKTTPAASAAPKKQETAGKAWQQMTQAEQDAEIAKLLPFNHATERFQAKPHEIYRWISVDKMPIWLVDGEVRFHPVELEQWLAQIGDVEKLRAKERREKQELVAKSDQP